MIWMAVGLGMYLLPEAARALAGGDDARRVLARTLGARPVAAACRWSRCTRWPVSRCCAAVFGEDLTGASDALPWLGGRDDIAGVLLPVRAVPAGARERGFVPVLGLAAVVRRGLWPAVGDDLTASPSRSPACRHCAAVWPALRARHGRHGRPGGRAPAPLMAERYWTSGWTTPPRSLGVGGGTAVFVSGRASSHGRDPVARHRGRRAGTGGGGPRHAPAGPVPCAASDPRPVRDRRDQPTPGRRRTRAPLLPQRVLGARRSSGPERGTAPVGGARPCSTTAAR